MHGIKWKPSFDIKKGKQANKLLFKDPKEYEKMTPEQREKLTQEMMVHFKGKIASVQRGK